MQETRIQSLGWEDPLEEGMATHSGILAWRITERGAWKATVHSMAKSQIQVKQLNTHTHTHTHTRIKKATFSLFSHCEVLNPERCLKHERMHVTYVCIF